jgi:hypothetical protein
VAVVGAVLMTAVGIYLILAGGSDYLLIGWLLAVIGSALLPVNLFLRRLGVRAGIRRSGQRFDQQ